MTKRETALEALYEAVRVEVERDEKKLPPALVSLCRKVDELTWRLHRRREAADEFGDETCR